MKSTAEIISSIRRDKRRSHYLLMLDFDGTLSELAPQPELAVFHPPCRTALRVLARRQNVTLAFISGRTRTSLRQKVMIPGALYAGLHGMDDGRRRDVRKYAARIKTLAAALKKHFTHDAGIRVEYKRYAIAVHNKTTPRAKAARLDESIIAETSASEHFRGLRMMHGKLVIEIVPDIACDKGSYALALFNETRKSHKNLFAFYMGDDLSDETAFAALEGKAYTVKVGDSGKSAAKYRLKNVNASGKFLADMAAAIIR